MNFLTIRDVEPAPSGNGGRHPGIKRARPPAAGSPPARHGARQDDPSCVDLRTIHQQINSAHQIQNHPLHSGFRRPAVAGFLARTARSSSRAARGWDCDRSPALITYFRPHIAWGRLADGLIKDHELSNYQGTRCIHADGSRKIFPWKQSNL